MRFGEEEEQEYRRFQRQRRQLVITIRREPLTKTEEPEAVSGRFSSKENRPPLQKRKLPSNAASAPSRKRCRPSKPYNKKDRKVLAPSPSVRTSSSSSSSSIPPDHQQSTQRRPLFHHRPLSVPFHQLSLLHLLCLHVPPFHQPPSPCLHLYLCTQQQFVINQLHQLQQHFTIKIPGAGVHGNVQIYMSYSSSSSSSSSSSAKSIQPRPIAPVQVTSVM